MTTAAPPRLTRRLYLRVKAKLARKRNVLKIASETGVDLQTISAIADGWTPDFPGPGRPRMDEQPDDSHPDDGLALQLRPEHRRRYEEIHARKAMRNAEC